MGGLSTRQQEAGASEVRGSQVWHWKCSQILSLGRNAIKKIEGLNEVSDTLEQLWISYNQIASFTGIEKLVNLTVLYASNNKIDKWPEVRPQRRLGPPIFAPRTHSCEMTYVACVGSICWSLSRGLALQGGRCVRGPTVDACPVQTFGPSARARC